VSPAGNTTRELLAELAERLLHEQGVNIVLVSVEIARGLRVWSEPVQVMVEPGEGGVIEMVMRDYRPGRADGGVVNGDGPAAGRARALELFAVFVSEDADAAESEFERLSHESPELVYWTILALTGFGGEAIRRVADVEDIDDLDVLASIEREFDGGEPT